LASRLVEVNLSPEYKSLSQRISFRTLANLCEQVLRGFSKSQLQQSADGRISTSAKWNNPEAQSKTNFTGLSQHSSARVSDFQLNGPRVWQEGSIFEWWDPGWGVELLRDGDRLAEHYRREPMVIGFRKDI
jgi:hypothetical protein